MVDFNNEKTIGTPSLDIQRVLVLQCHENTELSLEYYTKKQTEGIRISLSDLKSKLQHWYLKHYGYLKRTMKDLKEFDRLEKELVFNTSSLTERRIKEIMLFLIELEDNLKLTRLDLKPHYDRKNVEAENLAHGL